jgi:PAS domain S-box-containing protein
MRARMLRSLALCGIAVLALHVLGSKAEAQAAGQPRTVLAIQWSSEDFPSTFPLDAAVREVLLGTTDAPVDYFTEYLESDRFPVEEAESALSNYIREKYAARSIDAVVAVSDAALAFALRYRAALFPNAPIIASTATVIDERVRAESAGATGVIGGVAYDRTLAMALQLHPSTRQVFVVAYAPTLDLVERVRSELQPFASRVELTYFGDASLDRLLAVVKGLPDDSLVLLVRHSQEQGKILFPPDVARLVSEASRVPVYGVSDSYVGTGVVGGVVTSREQIGRRLGEMVAQVLAGARAQDIPMEPVPLRPTLDWRELTRWGIDPSVLPGGADFRFRQPTPWERYRGYIMGAVGLIALQTVLIGALLVQRRRRQRAEAALRESEALFRNMADTAPVMLWRTGVDRRCDFVNKTWLSFTGRSLEQELGDGWADSIHADDRADALDTFNQAFDAHEPFQMEYRLRRYDGEFHVVLDSGVPRRENDGSFAGYLGSCVDITDRKQADRALQEIHAELSRVSRLTALGEFAASIAHEVRQPLTAIIINARICLRWLSAQEPDLEEVKAGLLDVVTAGQRAEEVIKRNRELFRHHKVEAAPVDINTVIGDAAALVSARLRDNQITLNIALGEELPSVTGDRIELEQVLLNLIANSIDAMERMPAESRRIDISSSSTGDQFVQVTVTDQGTGLEGVDLEKMFTLSYTTKDSGTGVGLSVSRSIVEAHGGRLWAEPRAGRGATFCFTVPVHSSVVAV